jgi:CheY-like chemotaxis protein
LRILFAEDNLTHKILIEFILKNELKIENVDFARDGQETHKILYQNLKEKQAYDWIILDYSMPIIDGITVITWYLSKCKRNKIKPSPIILISAYTREYFDENYDLASLKVNFMSKPINSGDLR